jgi:thiol-disulfide isomerase/thioredoxin
MEPLAHRLRPGLFSLALTITLATLAVAIGTATESSATAPAGVTLSIQGMDCSGCWARALKELRSVPGVRDATLDTRTVEATVRLSAAVTVDSLRAAVARAGFAAVEGPGCGQWKAPKGYPEGSDVAIVSHDGGVIGELAALAVPGKVTLVDLYADWCAPCRMIDAHVAKLLAGRSDLAVRKINIVKWGTPAAKAYLGERPSIPWMIVYGKDGAKVATVSGYRPRELDAAIKKGAGPGADASAADAASGPQAEKAAAK